MDLNTPVISLRILLLATVLGTGCAAPFSAPSSYENQRYLCTDAGAADFQNAVATCQQGSTACAGVFSMQGMLEGEALTVNTQLIEAQFQVVQPPGGLLRSLDEAQMIGNAPYFRFVFDAKSIGGEVSSPNSLERVLTVSSAATSQPDPLQDNFIDIRLLLESAGQNDELSGLNASGSVTLTYQSDQELRGSFTASFGTAADVTEGCFDMFPLRTSIVPAPVQ